MRAAPSQGKSRAQAISGIGRGAVGQSQITDKSGRITEYWSEDDKCPICKTDRYLSPRLRLMVSPCYHKMCESCIDRLFSLGPAACPVCGQIVRKQQFSAQTFQDLRVEEEVTIRKRVAKLFNRKPDDFPSLKAYNDYLEEFEEITFNLVNKIDVEHTQQRLAQYEALNKSVIAAHQQQREQESEMQLQADQEARNERALRAQRVRAEQEREQQEREEEEKEIVAELAKGRSIEDVMRDREKRMEARTREAQKREREEQQRLQEYEEQLKAKRRAVPKTKQSPAEMELVREIALSDYDGAFATIDDGAALAPPRAAPASLGGLGTSADGYVDPWLKPELATKQAAAQYRAGGYDWQHQVWQRGLSAACDALALRPARRA
ncbi:TFIIH/NER complex subunit [Malassezia japonica]|uniref:RNA polymerase II transcription factor B subunit 3 n=1 Tax=Malassezia japonica TaxID=223818 RepID=A0AAF0JHK4_9BASI|nr:TFIIH/NER complex subunit [Malassezia japonica]WFD40906.1 TFIIH/NER complex subunit [Malassezia japonica]